MKPMLLLYLLLVPYLLTAQTIPIKDLETRTVPLELLADSLLVRQTDADGYTTYWNREGRVQDDIPAFYAIEIQLRQEGAFADLQLPIKNLYNDPRQRYPVYCRFDDKGKPYSTPKSGKEETPYWGIDVQYVCQGQPRTASFRFCNKLVEQDSYLCHSIDGVWQPQQFLDFNFYRPVFEVNVVWDGTVFSYNYNQLLSIPDRVERITGITCWVGSGAQLRIGPEAAYSVFDPRSKVPF